MDYIISFFSSLYLKFGEVWQMDNLIVILLKILHLLFQDYACWQFYWVLLLLFLDFRSCSSKSVKATQTIPMNKKNPPIVTCWIDRISTVMFSGNGLAILTMSHHHSVTSQWILLPSWCTDLFRLFDGQGISPETIPMLGWLMRYTRRTCTMYACYDLVTWVSNFFIRNVVNFLLMFHHDVCIYLCHVENLPCKKYKFSDLNVSN